MRSFRNPTRAIVALMSVLLAGCAGTTYRPPAPGQAAVGDVRAEVASAMPVRRPLTLNDANGIVLPIFEKISTDASMVCRTIAEADSCTVPVFEVLDVEGVNARAGYDLQNRLRISLTRGLVEYLADAPDELALVIGHEYGHVVAAHVRVPERSGGDDAVMGTALGALAAAAASAVTGRDDRERMFPTRYGDRPTQAEIDEYLEDTADPEGDYLWFSRGEELEADYLGTYLAVRSGYAPTGRALIELGALSRLDALSALEKEERKLAYAYWDTHPWSPDRAARFRETLAEIEVLQSKGYARPLPPRLILAIQDDNRAFHSLEELVSPLP